jgi:alpha-tubulin suppressor-like RCC1 family protein
MSRTVTLGILKIATSLLVVAMVSACTAPTPPPPVEGAQRALSGPAPELSATAPSAATVVLSWSDVTGETGYYVDRSTDGGQSFAQAQSLGAGVTTWTDTGRSALNTYCYRVRAYDGAGSSSSEVQCVLTPQDYEAESLGWTKSSASVGVVSDPAASAGSLLSATVTTVGGWVQLATTTPSTGVYGTKIRYRATPDAGRFVVTVGGVPYGSEVDGYAPSPTFREVYLGEVDILAADASRKLRFALTGRNPLSTGNKIQIDVITMYVAQFRYEAESSGAVTSSGDSQTSSNASGASNGKVNVATLNAVGDYVRYSIAVGAPGTYSVSLRIRKGSNRGRFRAWLDETTALGSEIDGYASSNTLEVIPLGAAAIGVAGDHTVKLQVTGKNSSASSYGITVDDIDLRLVAGNGCSLFGDAIPDGTACDDASMCTQDDICQAGSCAGTTSVVCTASDQCHDVGTCDPGTGQCSNPAKAEGASCDDGNPCTQTDSCEAGACTGGNPVTCAASDQCHEVGTCDPGTGQCSNPAKPDGTGCDDGNPCTQTDTCEAGLCTGGNPVTCTALDQCHEAGLCDPATGQCLSPAKLDGTGCNDGNPCTQTDTCEAGMCTGANPVTCTASDQCHAAGTCDPGSGQCSNPTMPDGTGCNDGSACTQTDTCQGGLCVGASPVICTASDQCHAAGACDPGTGHCGAGAAKPDGVGCDDGNGCTQTDVCQAGTCAGTPVTCTASDACHEAGTCDQATGQCTNPVKIGACLRSSPKLSAGNASTCAIRTDGSLACWGENFSGETTAPAGTFTQVSVGAGFACGLLADGTPRCWGGYVSQYTPTWASFVQIAAGGYGACGLQQDGSATCWGGLSLDGWPHTQIAAGYDHACGVMADGAVRCIGRDNEWGEATPPEGPFVQVVAGEWRSCGLRPDGTATCWGRQATEYPPPTATFERLAAGGASTCGLTAAGEILCWGSGGAAQTPPPVGPFVNLTVGGDRACAIRADNSIACWGSDWRGPDWAGVNSVPVGQFQEVSNSGGAGCRRDANGRASCWGLGVVPPAEVSLRQIAAGSAGSCGVLADGTGACWCAPSDWSCQAPFGNVAQVGMGSFGGSSDTVCWLGTDGAITCSGMPQGYPPSGVFRQVAVAYDAACAVRDDGTATCWGYENGWGLTTPPAGTFKQLALGSGHGCGIRTDGTLACWGYNGYGQATPPAGEFGAIAVGESASCAIKTDGTLACWGGYEYGPSFVPPAGPFRQLSGAGMTFCAISTSGQEWCWGQIVRQPLLCAVEPDGACIATEPVVCPPTDACHTPGVFDPVTRQCASSALPDGTACSDGSACTQSDACQAGVCVGSNAVVCTTEPWDQCRPNVCDPSSGQCVSTTLPDGSACNDMNACTQTDTCQFGYCMGGNPVQCGASDNPCVYAGMCDPWTGQCGPSYAAPDGASCDDGNACTRNDTCQGGSCAGNPVVCAGEGDCYQAGACEPSTGQCSYLAKAEGAGCDDRNPCTENDVCQAGACVGSAVGGTCEAASGAWLSAGYAHTCARRPDGTIVCWGQNYFGQSTPPPGAFKQVTTGYLFSCALRTDGTPLCWGTNSSYQTNALSGPYAKLASGFDMSCGLTESGQPQCWGRYYNGWPTGTFAQIALGSVFGCGLRGDGSISCWGANDVGQGSPPAGVGYRKVTAGAYHACAITAQDNVVCWGDLPGTPTPTGQFVDLDAGHAHTCGLRSNGVVACWGQAPGSPPPGGFVAISAGNDHDCAMRGDGSVACWGMNDDGQASVPF